MLVLVNCRLTNPVTNISEGSLIIQSRRVNVNNCRSARVAARIEALANLGVVIATNHVMAQKVTNAIVIHYTFR